MFVFRLIALLPLSVLYRISDFLFVLGFYVIGYRRKLVQKNLRNSFPEKSKVELKTIERAYYRNLCDYVVETLKLLTIGDKDLSARMHYKNVELFEHYAHEKKSVLVLASHQFNWEWVLVSGNLKLPMNLDFVYQPVKTSLTDKLLLACRTRFGAHAIKRHELAREVVKRRNLLRGIAIVADQYPGYKRDKKYVSTFLNQETAFFYGTNQLAALTQYPVLFADVKKIKRGYYEVTLLPLAEPPHNKDSDDIIEKYILASEKVIRNDPSGWLWSHNRWKKRHLTQASAKYPRA
jgi:Kdo2-lipid IVA lauroyltransferase/acyltransferase